MNLKINYLKLPNLTKKKNEESFMSPKNLTNIPVVGSSPREEEELV